LRTDPRTGQTSPTYSEAARQQGFVDDADPSSEWELVFEETVQRQGTAADMRNLFIIAVQDGADGTRLWEAASDYMIDDWRRSKDINVCVCEELGLVPNEPLSRTVEQRKLRDDFCTVYAEALVMQNIRERIERSALSLDSVIPLPKPDTKSLRHFRHLARNRRMLYSEAEVSIEPWDGDSWESLDADVKALNDLQNAAYRTVCESFISGDGRCFFLGGLGGRGKSHLIRILMKSARIRKLPACVTATTGTAALEFDSGCTIHSLLELPVPDEVESMPSIATGVPAGSDRAKYLKCLTFLWLLRDYHLQFNCSG